MSTSTVEIHCPKCGVLIRAAKTQQLKEHKCPDCGNPQAIFLNYWPDVQRSILEHKREAAMRCIEG